MPKSQLSFGDRTLLGHALAAGQEFCHQVVVGPAELSVPAGVRLVREDPPFGGPVAGIGAGVAELDRLGCDAEWLLITACDHPHAEAAARALFESLSCDAWGASQHKERSAPGPGAVPGLGPGPRDHPNLEFLDHLDLITPTDATGHRQTLFALYRRSALARALDACQGGHDLSVRRLIADLRSASVRLPDDLLDDVDDPAAAQRLGIRVPQAPDQ